MLTKIRGTLATALLMRCGHALRMPSARRSFATRMSVSPLLEAEAALKSTNLKFIDGSWHLGNGRVGADEFKEKRIQGAGFFDIDVVADTSSSLPHMLPEPAAFAACMEDMGVANDDHVVVYTTADCFSAARVWWTFKAFQHEKVSILQGGLPAWEAAGGKTESGPPAAAAKAAYAAPDGVRLVSDWREVLRVSDSLAAGGGGGQQVVDARSAARFNAEVDEPRPGVGRGRIPGSVNLPFNKLLEDGDMTRFKDVDAMKAVFADAGIDVSAAALGSTINSCGSGVTAAVLSFGMHLCAPDADIARVYDGAWGEWGSRLDELPGAA